jgi:hypothetical protein
VLVICDEESAPLSPAQIAADPDHQVWIAERSAACSGAASGSDLSPTPLPSGWQGVTLVSEGAFAETKATARSSSTSPSECLALPPAAHTW